MKKRILAVLSALALVPALMLTGCAKDDTNSDANAGTGEDNSLQKVLDAGEFVLGLDATFKPMGFTDENDNVVGFDIDCAEEVCKRMGVTLVKKGIDWDTKEQDLNAGNIDCIWNGMSVDPSRAEQMNLSEAYMENAMVFVVKNGSEYTTQASLEGKNIAVQSGSPAQKIMEADTMNKTVTALGTNVECLQQLELDIVDAVYLDSVVAKYEISTLGKDYVILDDGAETEEYAIGFRKNDSALRNEVQRILSEMKADGTLGQISTNWFGSDITTVK